mmetsp:Transcript_49339/g.91026  ORF Transcript_49339/g.91026 Transcript_49339/m.91026 type:complete len:212 (-) Transcript_49339:333-968(-)
MSRALAVRVVPPGHSMSSRAVVTASASSVKWVTHSMLHCLNSSQLLGAFRLPMQMSNLRKLLGPLKSNIENSTSSSPRERVLANFFAASTLANQPSSPKLPLPSMTNMTSTLDLHSKNGLVSLISKVSSQDWVLHGWNWSLCGSSSSSQQRPSPVASFSTWRTRFCDPPPQTLSHSLHSHHSASSQFWSQLCVLQLSASEVASQGCPSKAA